MATSGNTLLTLVAEVRADVVVIDGFRGIRSADLEPNRARIPLRPRCVAPAFLG